MPKATLRLDLIRILATHTRRDPAKPHIAGIQIEPLPRGGVVMVAVNDESILAIHDRTAAASERMLIDPAHLIKVSVDSKTTPIVDIEGLAATVRRIDGWTFGTPLVRYRTEGTVELETPVVMDEKLFDWRRRMDACRATQVVPPMFHDARVVGTFYDNAKKLAKVYPGSETIVRMVPTGYGTRVSFHADIPAMGLAMPVIEGIKVPDFPEWVLPEAYRPISDEDLF